jgi:hypothetical protein
MSTVKEPPHGTLGTPIGPVCFTMTGADHVHLCSRDEHPVTIRRIPYHVSFHCYLIQGTWQTKDWHEPYLSRRDKQSCQEPSQPARKAAREILAKAWTNYLSLHADLSRLAEQARLTYEVDRLESELADLREKVAAKAAELMTLRQQEATLKKGTA